MAKKLRVGILFGGRSGEHEISLLSAASILQAIDRSQYEIFPIGIDKEGRWLFSADAENLLSANSRAAGAASQGDAAPGAASPPGKSRAIATPGAKTTANSVLARSNGAAQPEALPGANQLNLDVVFPVLHGTFGEDGTIQGLLELADLAYVGSGVLGSAAGMDKDVMKRLFLAAKFPTPKYEAIFRHEWEKQPKKVIARIEGALKYPLFVKPANLGSSVGISKVHGRKELGPAMDEAVGFDRKVVVEQAVGSRGRLGRARELEVAILGNDDPKASVVGEVIPGKEFYDYEAKYQSEGSRNVIPAEITKEQSRQIREMAVGAFRCCDCSGLARVDFLMEPGGSGRIFLNELNTMPGFTAISQYPKLWEASGIGYRELISRLIDLALERRAEKDRTRFRRSD